MAIEEYQVTDQDVITIDDSGLIRTYTSGTRDPLYTGTDLDAAAASLDVPRDDLDQVLMSDAVIRDSDND